MRGSTARTVAIGGALAVALAGCSGGFPGPAPTPAPIVTVTAEPPREPTAQERLDAAIAAIPERVESLLDETGVPGLSVAVVSGGETVYAAGFGTADLGTGAPVGPDTVFQLASISKPVGASLVSRLVTEGRVSWDLPVREGLPWFRLSEAWPSSQLTVADLYAHRSGLPDHAGDDLEWLGFDQRTILERLRLVPLEGFRTGYAYTNYGIEAGALAVADAVGGTWERLSADELYAPLGMERTTSSFAEYVAMDDHAVGHSVVDGAWQVTPEQFDPERTAAAASVASSANDMARWMTAMIDAANATGGVDGEPFLSPEAVSEWLTPRMPTRPLDDAARVPTMYGYGVNLSSSATGAMVVSHSGAFAQGAGTYVGMIPADDIGIVVLTNGFPLGVAETVGAAFLDEATVGEQTRPWWDLYREAFAHALALVGDPVGAPPPARVVDARPLGDYAGSYRNGWVGEAVVEERDGVLWLLLGPDPGTVGREYPLDHVTGDAFRYELEALQAAEGSTSSVVFDVTAGTMTIGFYDGLGLGTLERVVAAP